MERPVPTSVRLAWHAAGLSPGDVDFLRRRVGLFGLVGGGLSAVVLVHRLATEVLERHASALTDPSIVAHATAAILLLGAWAAMHLRRWSLHAVVAIEALSFIGSSVAYLVMASDLPLVVRPELVLALALTYGLIARAAFVPDSAWKTAAYGTVLTIAAVPVTWSLYLHAPPAMMEMVRSDLLQDDEQAFARLAATYGALFLGLSTVLATVVAHVLHGLRSEVTAARRLGQYELEERIGSGGMGEVYRARHLLLRRPTAVKLLPASAVGEEALQRFEREVRLTAGLSHPNTITVFDYGRGIDGVFYYAMELVEGATLSDVIAATGPMPSERVAHVLLQAAGALAEAHAVGLVHRDVKPSNIMLCERGGIADTVKVLDFGLVKDLAESESPGVSAAVSGTPHTMSPEAIRSPFSVDARSDIYSLGAVAYYLLTGGPVFVGETAREVFDGHLSDEPEPPSRRVDGDVDAELEALVLACLAKDPARRPQSALELRRRLLRCACAGLWTEERARHWWRTHVDSIAARSAERSAGVSADAPTVAVEPTLWSVDARHDR